MTTSLTQIEDFSLQAQTVSTLRLRPRRLSLEQKEIDEIDEKIIEERNKEIKQIEKDVEDISEITQDMRMLLHQQGELIDQALYHLTSSEIHVNEACQSLEISEEHQTNMIGTIVDASAVAVCVGLGAFGFFGGVVVGVPTLIAGGVVSGCFILIRRLHFQKK